MLCLGGAPFRIKLAAEAEVRRQPPDTNVNRCNVVSFAKLKILRTISSFAPGRSVSQDPINQGTFKTDIAASFLALDPFVTKDLLAFS